MLSNKIKKYIQENKLFSKGDKIMLSISGGADSVCLMHILIDLNILFELAHCNFRLRGKESDGDEAFVKRLARKYNIKLHCKSFHTKEYSTKNKLSIQMAAREMRYKWLNKLIVTQKATFIACAHQRDDVVETFFINLIKGAGITGLSSIPKKNVNIVRPLINTSRNDIETYLSEKKQVFRNDSSNQSTDYLRNKIRHNIIPLFKEINPKINDKIINEINIFNETKYIFYQQINRIKKKIVNIKNGVISINIDEIQRLNPIGTYLFEILKPYGFNQIKDITSAIDMQQSGKQFFSNTHHLVIDRQAVLIKEIELTYSDGLLIDKSVHFIKEPINIFFTSSKIKKINKKVTIGQFDYDKLKFPLKLRKWKHGDKFQPLGMEKYQKLSDFFIDNKFSLLQKKEQWLLCSNNDIIWIVGYRIDNRYKVTGATKKLYIAEFFKR